MVELKKKPVKLNVEIVLAEGATPPAQSQPPKPGRTGSAAAPTPIQPPKAGYDLRARYEKKGRGGQPVFVLYAFDHASLRQKGHADLRSLAKLLKEKLSCGGTLHEDPIEEIILQFRDRDRLEAVLARHGLKMQLSGG